MTLRTTNPTTVRDVMTTPARAVGPDTTLIDLERKFLEARVSGFPVVESDQLVGIVTRSDVVRKLVVEQTIAETIAAGTREATAFSSDASMQELAMQVARRLAESRVRDAMVREIHTVAPSDSLAMLARLLIVHGIHRAPVTEDGRLVGVVTSLDLVRTLIDY